MCRYPADRAQDLKDQPPGFRSVSGARRLWLRHMPRGTEHATCQTRQERAPVSPRVLRHRARHASGEGSGVATCPEAPSPSPDRRRLQSRHVPHGYRLAPAQGGSGIATWPRHQDHRPAGLRYRHVSCGSRPGSWCGRAQEPPCAQWLSALGRIRAFSRRLTSGPSWPQQPRGAGSALNAYVTGHTQRMTSIKYIQDIGAAER
jgi:hypothetical protein